ncbi:MAG: BamA/TamA family outer membrane protein [Aquificaceae bacterium]
MIIYLLALLYPIVTMSKVYIMSNFPLLGNNLESVINDRNYKSMIEVIKKVDGVMDVYLMEETGDVYIYVERYPILRKVIIKGNQAIWSSTIMDRLGLYEGMPFKDIKGKDLEEKLKRIYKNEGFFEAHVAVTFRMDEDGFVDLYIGVDEGNIYFTAGGIYEGTSINEEELDRKLGIVKGRVSKESEFEDMVFKLQDVYIGKGFFDSLVYFNGTRLERAKKPFFDVLFPRDERIEKRPLRVIGSISEGLSNLFSHPIGTWKALIGKGHVAYPVFSIIEGKRYQIDFIGATFFKPSYLVEVSGLEEKGIDPFSLEEAKINIEKEYRRKGFFDVSVDHQFHGQRVSFHIDEGQRYTALIEEKAFPYDEDLIKKYIEEKIKKLKRDGYMLAEGSYSLKLDKEKKTADVEVIINIGKRQILKEFIYKGGDKELDKLFKNYNSKLPTFYDTSVIESLNLDIKKYFLRKGFMEGDFYEDVSLEDSQDTTFYTYIYTVNEGPRYKLGEDVYYGYKHTKQREISYMTQRGRYYSEASNDRTLNNMITSSLFSGVKVDNFLDKDNKVVHRLIQVSEDKRGMFDLSLGYNTEEKIALDTFLGWKNLLGIGLNTGLRYRKTGKRELYNLDFSDDFLFTRRLWFKSSIFKNHEEHRSYTLTSRGGTLNVGYRITDNTSIGPVISRTSNLALGQLIDINKYGLFLLREYKDDIFSPRRLHYNSTSITWSSGDRKYIKFDLSTFYLIPIGNSMNLSFKVAGGYVSKKAPIFERFFLGGIKDMRGYDFETIGQPQGGRYYTFGRLELEFPLRSPFVGIVFFDVGNVGNKFYQTLKNSKEDVGGAVGVKTPVGPIRLDLAFPLEKDTLKKFKFYLSVGYYY